MNQKKNKTKEPHSCGEREREREKFQTWRMEKNMFVTKRTWNQTMFYPSIHFFGKQAKNYHINSIIKPNWRGNNNKHTTHIIKYFLFDGSELQEQKNKKQNVPFAYMRMMVVMVFLFVCLFVCLVFGCKKQQQRWPYIVREWVNDIKLIIFGYEQKLERERESLFSVFSMFFFLGNSGIHL